MLPDEIYKRKHYGTPWFVTVIIANYVVCAVLISFYHQAKLNWFFWIVIAVLAVYNFFEFRRNWEEIDRVAIISLAISIAGLVLLYFLF